MGPSNYVYPPDSTPPEEYFGIFPVDFILESILQLGMEWFNSDPKAPDLVFGHLKAPYLSKYGPAKIVEIAAYIKKYEVKIVQHFALIDMEVPCISINLLDGSEETDRAALADHMQDIDRLGIDDEVLGRVAVGYAPIIDNIHIGIHNITTPDLTKYLYSLVIYILNAFKPQLEDRGMHLGTFRATDISKLIEYLPENMYSRFINFSVFTTARFSKGDVPIIDRIIGVSVPTGSNVSDVSSEIVVDTGVTVLGS